MLIPRAHPKERLQQMVAATPFGTGEIREAPLEYEVVLRKRSEQSLLSLEGRGLG
mgnify:CR=1 FL=1